MLSPDELVTRPATAADEADIRACVQAAYQPYVARMGKPPAPMLDDYAELIRTGVVRVASRSGDLVGLIVLWPEADHLYVDNIAVHPAAQGSRVGTALLAAADREAITLGLDEIRLYTNVAMVENIEYYPKRGFEETHRGTDAGYERVYFARHLGPPKDRSPTANLGSTVDADGRRCRRGDGCDGAVGCDG